MDHSPADHPLAPRPRRRAWALPVVITGALLVGVLAVAVVAAGLARSGGSGELAVSGAAGTVEGEVEALDALFQPVAFAEPQPAADRPFREGRRGHPLRLRDGEKVVAGAVAAVDGATLVVGKDSGADVRVPTDGDTVVRGAGNRALADLTAGERVLVRVGADGVADGVLAVRAHAAGTVTSLDGDRATVVRPGGLTVVLDLSGVAERPSVGTAVVAVGTAADGGATLRVERLRELATLG